MLELKRLYVDVGINIAEIIKSEKLQRIYAKQFTLRMNNGKRYEPEQILPGLKELITWVSKK